MRLPVALLIGALMLVVGALGIMRTTKSTPFHSMTTSNQHQGDRVPGEHASATLAIGQSVSNHEVTVTLLTPFVQTPAYYEGNPDDLRWWQFRVAETGGDDSLEFSLNHQYPELRFHDSLIHLEKGASNTATIVLRPLPTRPVPVTEGEAAARAIAATLKTEADFPEPIADQRVLEDRVWEIRVVPKGTHRAHYEVRVDAQTGNILSVEPAGGS